MSQVSPLDPARSVTALTRPLILSVKPRWAALLMEGSKTAELRRVPPRRPATTALLYCTAPVSAIVGVLSIARVDTMPVASLWLATFAHSRIDRSEYEDYFAGRDVGSVIWIDAAHRTTPLVRVAELRAVNKSWCTPQSFRYLSAAEQDVATLVESRTVVSTESISPV